MNELLLPKDQCEALVSEVSRFDIRDANDEAHTVQLVSVALFEHVRGNPRYEATVRDHRDQYWMTMVQAPYAENRLGSGEFLFTRLVDGVEYVVFDPAEAYEHVETRFRKVPGGF